MAKDPAWHQRRQGIGKMVDSLDIDLVSEPESARRARGELERFHDFLGDVRFEDLRLLISELVGEAVGGLGKSDCRSHPPARGMRRLPRAGVG